MSNLIQYNTIENPNTRERNLIEVAEGLMKTRFSISKNSDTIDIREYRKAYFRTPTEAELNFFKSADRILVIDQLKSCVSKQAEPRNIFAGKRYLTISLDVPSDFEIETIMVGQSIQRAEQIREQYFNRRGLWESIDEAQYRVLHTNIAEAYNVVNSLHSTLIG